MRDNVAKKGISLIVLVITIVVMIILLSAVVVSGDDSREVAKRATFISDLTTVQDAVKEYYIMNGNLPVYDDDKENVQYEFIFEDLKKLRNNDQDLINQVNLNKDSGGKFYLVNTSLLAVESLNYGKKYHTKNETDIFVVSYPNLNIYYVKGIKISGTRYYTLSKLLTGRDTTVTEQVDNSTTILSTQSKNGRIRVIKGNALTSTLDVNVIAQLNDNEKINIGIGGVISQITTKDGVNGITTGENVIVLNKVLTEEQINSIFSSREITLTITDSTDTTVESLNVNLDNLTTELPTFSSWSKTSLEDENMLTFTVNSNAGIAYLKYDYDESFDEASSLGVKKYYSNLDSTALDSYVYSRGKTAQVDSVGVCTIAAPKNIKSLRIIAVDKAGNAAYVTSDISQGLYTVAELNNYNDPNLFINTYVIATDGIKNATISYSLDGVTFTGQTSYTSNTQGAVNEMKTIQYANISANEIYIKVEATSYDGTVTASSVTKLKLKENTNNDESIDNEEIYTITYDLAGGTADNPTTYTASTPTFSLEKPTKDGYVFVGWTGSNGTTAQEEVTITIGSTGDRAYTANWKQNIITGNMIKQSPTSYIGKYVNYSGYSSNQSINWRIFNVKSDGTIQLIADNFPNLSGKSTTTGITIDGYTIYSTSDASTLVSYLTNTNNWSEFAVSGKTTATGTPTLIELNSSHYLLYGINNLTTGSYITNDDLYIKTSKYYGTNNVTAIWIAYAPTTSQLNGIMISDANPCFIAQPPSSANFLAVLPVISLNNAKLLEVNGKYLVY